jgi:hypothetical protein
VAAPDLQRNFQDIVMHHFSRLASTSVATVSRGAADEEETGNVYEPPNSLGLRRTYVVMDVRNSDRVQSLVPSDLRNEMYARHTALVVIMDICISCIPQNEHQSFNT